MKNLKLQKLTQSLIVAPFFGAALLAASPFSHAMKLSPIAMDFTTTGRGTTQTFVLENTNQEPIAAEVTVKSRKMNINGEDILQDAEDDFVIFPAQIVLQPGQKQNIRVQWIGKSIPKTELSYRMIAEQLPVDLGNRQVQGGGVRLLVRYIASLYIMPQGVKPEVKIKSANLIDSAGNKKIQFVLENTGTTRELLEKRALVITGDKASVTISDKEKLKGFSGENVLAGHERRFELPWPPELGTSLVNLRLDAIESR